MLSRSLAPARAAAQSDAATPAQHAPDGNGSRQTQPAVGHVAIVPSPAKPGGVCCSAPACAPPPATPGCRSNPARGASRVGAGGEAPFPRDERPLQAHRNASGFPPQTLLVPGSRAPLGCLLLGSAAESWPGAPAPPQQTGCRSVNKKSKHITERRRGSTEGKKGPCRHPQDAAEHRDHRGIGLPPAGAHAGPRQPRCAPRVRALYGAPPWAVTAGGQRQPGAAPPPGTSASEPLPLRVRLLIFIYLFP